MKSCLCTQFGRAMCRATLLFAVLVLPLGNAIAANTTLQFETQALDLDTGTVSEAFGMPTMEADTSDIKIAYHADRPQHAVLIPATDTVSFAVLPGVSYANATLADTTNLSFTSSPIDSLADVSGTVIVRTDTGAVFKLGNAVESATAVTFDYAPLQ